MRTIRVDVLRDRASLAVGRARGTRRSGRSRRASPPRRRSSAGSRRGGSSRPRPSASARGRAPTCARPPRGRAARRRCRARAARRRSGRSRARHEEQPERGLAVAAGAPHLLVVGLDRARRREVDHRAHVGAIDAHAEGVGRDHDLGARRRRTRAARARARAAPSPRGRRRARHPRPASRAAFLLAPLARRRVDDGRAAAARPGRRAPRRARRRRGASRSRAPVDLDRAQRQVRPREAVHDAAACPRAGRAAPGSRRARSASRSPCRRARARAGSSASSAADLEVLGPEVVAPLADAVRLVDRHQRARRGRASSAAEARRRRAARARRRRACTRPAAMLRHAPPHLAAVERRGEDTSRPRRARSSACT